MNQLWLLLGNDMRKLKSDAIGRKDVSPTRPFAGSILSGHI
jgi:hypothetical protein